MMYENYNSHKFLRSCLFNSHEYSTTIEVPQVVAESSALGTPHVLRGSDVPRAEV